MCVTQPCINLSIINLDLEHIDLNVPVVNLSEWEASIEKAAEEVEIVDPNLPLIVYDPFFQDIPIKEDAGKTSSKEEAQSDDEAPTEKEVEFPDVLYNVIVEVMNAAFNEVFLKNVAKKDQITNLNIQVQSLEAMVSNLNSTVVQLSFALINLTSLMIAHSNQSCHIAK